MPNMLKAYMRAVLKKSLITSWEHKLPFEASIRLSLSIFIHHYCYYYLLFLLRKEATCLAMTIFPLTEKN